MNDSPARPRVSDAEVDDAIDAWADSGSDLPLHEYLGWTADEYQAWVTGSGMLTLDD